MSAEEITLFAQEMADAYSFISRHGIIPWDHKEMATMHFAFSGNVRDWLSLTDDFKKRLDVSEAECASIPSLQKG